jgi:hypothetical protein
MELPACLPLRITYYLPMDMDARKQPGAEPVSFFSRNTFLALPWMLPLDLDLSASGWLACRVCHLLVCFFLAASAS